MVVTIMIAKQKSSKNGSPTNPKKSKWVLQLNSTWIALQYRFSSQECQLKKTAKQLKSTTVTTNCLTSIKRLHRCSTCWFKKRWTKLEWKCWKKKSWPSLRPSPRSTKKSEMQSWLKRSALRPQRHVLLQRSLDAGFNRKRASHSAKQLTRN